MSVLSRTQFDKLLLPIRSALYRIAVKLVGETAADDCLQNALILGWSQIARLDTYPLSQDLLRFLVPRLKQTCRQCQRERARTVVCYVPPEELLRLAEQVGVDSTLTLPDISPDVYAPLREHLYSLLHRTTLTTLQETCFRQWLEGVSQTQIALYLGVSQPMVRQHIAAATAKLKAVKYWSEEPEQWIWDFFWEQVRQIKASIPQKRSKSRPVQKVRARKTLQRTAVKVGQKSGEVSGANVLPE